MNHIIYVLYSSSFDQYITETIGDPSYSLTDHVHFAKHFDSYQDAKENCDPRNQFSIAKIWSNKNDLSPVKFEVTYNKK